jgi:hypothetical protein
MLYGVIGNFFSIKLPRKWCPCIPWRGVGGRLGGPRPCPLSTCGVGWGYKRPSVKFPQHPGCRAPASSIASPPALPLKGKITATAAAGLFQGDSHGNGGVGGSSQCLDGELAGWPRV